MIGSPCKCRDVVAVEEQKSSFYLKGGTRKHAEYNLGIVEHATRDGAAKAVRIHGSRLVRPEGDSRLRVLVIADHIQPQARAVLNDPSYPDAGFPSMDALRDAIRSATVPA